MEECTEKLPQTVLEVAIQRYTHSMEAPLIQEHPEARIDACMEEPTVTRIDGNPHQDSAALTETLNEGHPHQDPETHVKNLIEGHPHHDPETHVETLIEGHPHQDPEVLTKILIEGHPHKHTGASNDILVEIHPEASQATNKKEMPRKTSFRILYVFFS